MSNHDNSRRKFIKAAVYTAPVVMTLKAAPSFANSGSNLSKCEEGDNSLRCKVGNNLGEIENAYNQSQESGGFSSFIKSILKIFGL